MQTIHYDTVSSNTRRYTYAWMLTGMLRYPKSILSGFVLLTILLGLQIPNLQFQFSIHDLIIERLPETHTYQQHFRMFGSEETIRIIFKSRYIYDPLVFSTIEYVANASGRIPGVNRVISLPLYKKEFTSSPKESNEFEQKVVPVELFRKYLISPDAKVTSIILFLAKNADHTAILKQINDLLQEEKVGPVAYLMGIPIIDHFLEKMIQRDLFLFPMLLVAVSTLLIYLLLRTIPTVILILSTMLVSQVWTLGLLALLGLRISFLSTIAPLFLIGVQTAFGLQFITCCSRSDRMVSTTLDTVINTFDKTALPFIISIIFTLFALLSFLFNPVNVINEFGIYTFLGMVIFLLMIFTFFPLALFILPNTQKVNCSKYEVMIHHVNRFLNRIIWEPKKQSYVLPAFVGIVIICLVGAIRIKVDTTPLMLFKEKSKIVKNYTDEYSYMSGDFPICIVLKAPQKNYFFNTENVKIIERFQRFLQTLPGVHRTISLADHLKLMNYCSHAHLPEYYRIPEDWIVFNQLRQSAPSISNWKRLQTYVSSDFSTASIELNTRLMDYPQLQQLVGAIQEHIRKELAFDLQISVSGMGTALLTSNHYLVNSQIKSVVITLIMLFGLLWFLLISPKTGLIALLPTIFPMIFTLGLMGWLGIDCTLITGLIVTMVICISMGNVINYIIRYHTEFKKDLDSHRAMLTVMRDLDAPIVFGGITICIGFSILFYSGFAPISNITVVIIPATMAMLAANLILLPVLFQKVELVTIWDLLRLKLGKSPDPEIPLFNELARHQIHSILMAGTLQKLNPSDILFNKGDTSDTMYAIVSGSLDIINFHRYEDATGVHEIKKVVNQLQAGDVVGEMGFFRSTQRSATAIATVPTELLQINWHMIQRLQWLYPLTAQKFFINLMGIICDRLENMTNSLCDQSLVDDLTGLFNKKGFTQMLETEANRAQRYREELTICLIGVDLDSEEKITAANSKAMEVMIRAVCQMLSREIRRTDILSRIDDTTFAMAAPKMSQPQAKILCQRLRRILHRNLLGFGSPSLQVRLIAAHLARGGKETGMELLERSLTLLQATQK